MPVLLALTVFSAVGVGLLVWKGTGRNTPYKPPSRPWKRK